MASSSASIFLLLILLKIPTLHGQDVCNNGEPRQECGKNENSTSCVEIGCCYNETNGNHFCFHNLEPTDDTGCQVMNAGKEDCINKVHAKLTKMTCENEGCCWNPCTTSECKNKNVPWCFLKSDYGTTTWCSTSSQHQMSTLSGFSRAITTGKRGSPKSVTSSPSFSEHSTSVGQPSPDYVVPVAVSVGLLVLIGIVIAVVMWYRCRRAKRSKSDNPSSEPAVKYNNKHDVDMEPVFMHANDIYDGCEIQSDTFPDHTLREPTEVDNVSTPQESGMMPDVANPLYMAPVSTVNKGVTSGQTRGVDKAGPDQMSKAKQTANGTKEPTAQDQHRQMLTNGNSFADTLENDTYTYFLPDATLKKLTSGKDDAPRSAGNKEPPHNTYDVPRSLINWSKTGATDDAPSPLLKDELAPHDHVQPRTTSSGSSDTVPGQQQKSTKDGKAGQVPKESATNSSRQNGRGNRPPPKDLYAKVDKHKKGAKFARGDRSDAVANLDQVLQDLQQTNDSLEQVAIRLETQDEDGNSKVPTSENVYVNQGYVKEHF